MFKRGNMAAFSYSNRYQIEQNLHTLMARRLSLPGLTLTHEEYIDTFVPAHVRQLFRDITPYHGVRGYAHAKLELKPFGAPGIAAFHIAGTDKPAPPLVAGLEPQPDAPPEIVERIRIWAENGGDVYRDFGRVLFVFNYLNQNYSRAALRHYWPTIMALCDAETTQHLLEDLQSSKAPSGLKPLPTGMVQLCRATASTIATARLIPETTASGGDKRGEVTIMSGAAQQYREHGFEFYGLA